MHWPQQPTTSRRPAGVPVNPGATKSNFPRDTAAQHGRKRYASLSNLGQAWHQAPRTASALTGNQQGRPDPARWPQWPGLHRLSEISTSSTPTTLPSATRWRSRICPTGCVAAQANSARLADKRPRPDPGPAARAAKLLIKAATTSAKQTAASARSPSAAIKKVQAKHGMKPERSPRHEGLQASRRQVKPALPTPRA